MPSARVAALALAALLVAAPAAAQPLPLREGVVGAWLFVSVVSQRDDGTREEPFGPNPNGIIVFTADGRFSLFQSAARLPRVAANDRTRATAEEAQAIVAGSIAYHGTYTVNDATRELALVIEGSTYANLTGGAPQRRVVAALTATELAFTNPRTPSGLTLHTTWRRAPPP